MSTKGLQFPARASLIVEEEPQHHSTQNRSVNTFPSALATKKKPLLTVAGA